MTEVTDYERGFADAIRMASQLPLERSVLGYVSDIGCFNCFKRISEAIGALTPIGGFIEHRRE